MPQHLVYPILFLVHHFLELELKSAIQLTYSIGYLTGELAKQQINRTHNLNDLLCLLKLNLAKLDTVPDGSPTQGTSHFIEDVAKFGVFGESLRYPITTIEAKTRRKAIGSNWPDGLIVEMEAVIDQAKKAEGDFVGLISYLLEYEDKLIDYEREREYRLVEYELEREQEST